MSDANARVALGAVHHFSLAVRDPDASAQWWCKAFDLVEAFRHEGRLALRNDAILIVLFEGEPDPRALGHMAFAVEDVEALRSATATLKQHGVDLEDPGNEIGPVGPGSASLGVWFHDPDGYRWELFVGG